MKKGLVVLLLVSGELHIAGTMGSSSRGTEAPGDGTETGRASGKTFRARLAELR